MELAWSGWKGGLGTPNSAMLWGSGLAKVSDGGLGSVLEASLE